MSDTSLIIPYMTNEPSRVIIEAFGDSLNHILTDKSEILNIGITRLFRYTDVHAHISVFPIGEYGKLRGCAYRVHNLENDTDELIGRVIGYNPMAGGSLNINEFVQAPRPYQDIAKRHGTKIGYIPSLDGDIPSSAIDMVKAYIQSNETLLILTCIQKDLVITEEDTKQLLSRLGL